MGRRPSPRAVARERFGFELRPGQEEAIRSVLGGRDTLVVMPTGAGKSAIYQIAGVLLAGPTVVVSPLVALQRDQVEGLEELGVGGASEVNATLAAAERREAFENLEEEELEFVFLAPEQFGNEETLARVREAAPSLFVVDEAHCVSEWGHDFRPDYLRLRAVAEALGRPTVLALTATAAPPVREEIVERLGMKEVEVVVRGFDRPNLWLGVESFHEEEAKTEALLARVERAAKPGIVYAATRKGAEEVAARLAARGVHAAPYHAGLKVSERHAVQEAFMGDELEVVVATIAFGMGIDKPNVRFVFHHDVSESVDSYYQEIGRAGRDGERAEAILFYRPQDLGLRRFFAAGPRLDAADAERVAEVAAAGGGGLALEEVAGKAGVSESKTAAVLSRLEDAGAVDVEPTGEVTPAEGANLAEAGEEVERAQERRRELDRSRVEMMRGYAELRDCRREYLLNYFGEEFQAPCGCCDNCEAGVVVVDDERRQPFPLNTRVRHAAWGQGLVQRYEADKMVVLFEEAGYKTLDVDLVVERSLLERAG